MTTLVEQGRIRPIVFIGPSLPLELARRTLPNAEYRAPIQRGDLERLAPGAVIGIIDGVFAQTLAISPSEIREAIERGVVVYGAGSMGALRAAEIPKVIGVGRIFEMYRSGTIERDDEVALLFDPETYKPLTEPLINVRYAVERLVSAATLRREAGAALVEACAALHYTERTYAAIFRNSPLAKNQDLDDIQRLLQRFNLKRDDAQFLLETLAALKEPPAIPDAGPPVQAPVPDGFGAAFELDRRVQSSEASDAPILIWESGDSLEFEELLQFLKVTGCYERFARGALGRFAAGGAPLRAPAAATATADDGQAQSLLDATRLVWGWESPEEAHVTMRDLGIGLRDLASSIDAEVRAKRGVDGFSSQRSNVFAKALRADLFLADLSLKREALRCGALRYFTELGRLEGPASEQELDDARRSMCRFRAALQWPSVCSELGALGMSPAEIDGRAEALALARRVARPVVAALDGRGSSSAAPRAARWAELGLAYENSAKAPGSRRFSRAFSDAAGPAEAIAKQIGVVRIGMIGELDTLGVHVAQAFGERSGWSASFSSGKSETREGARIGAIMEEVEIHAQDAFRPAPEFRGSFTSARERGGIDPLTLELPYDSRYEPSLEIDWSKSVDLLGSREVLVPTACLMGERLANDVYYSPRLGGKIFSSSGLGSGFSLAEATLHAAAECIERHALRLAEVELDNPAKVGVRQFWFIDHASLPETPRSVLDKYLAAGMCVRILDMTSEIAVPTFFVRVFDDPFQTEGSTSSDGFACHPDPEVAVTMALLEAAQTKAGVIAGGREDYSLQARSLGRHERPRTMVPASQVFWFCNDRPTRPLQETAGFETRDILEELEWLVERVRAAGFEQFLVTDFSVARIRPAHAVRVTIPGIETTNPLYTGARARATLIRDLLPRSAAATADPRRR